MDTKDVILVGAPMDAGKHRQGCRMGPDAYRVAGLAHALTELGHHIVDHGDVRPVETELPEHPHLFALPECVGWTRALKQAALDAAAQGLPIFMGGDHALSMGTVTGMAEYAIQLGPPAVCFVA